MNPGPFSTNLWHQIPRKEESGSKIIRLAGSVTERETFSSSNVKERPSENKTKAAWWRASPFPRQQTLGRFFLPKPEAMLLRRRECSCVVSYPPTLAAASTLPTTNLAMVELPFWRKTGGVQWALAGTSQSTLSFQGVQMYHFESCWPNPK